MFELIKYLDINIIMFIQKNMHNSLLDKIMIIITSLGNSGMVWILLCTIFIISKKYRTVGIKMMCALLLVSILGEGIIKHSVHRIRPCFDMPTVQILIKRPHSYSFPSGHSASSFAVASTLFLNIRKYGIYALILAILISFSRLYLFVHYPSDVIAGIILGILCANLVQHAYQKIKNNILG